MAIQGSAVPKLQVDEGASASPERKTIVDQLVQVFNQMVEVKVVTILEQVELDLQAPQGRTMATITPFKKDLNALVTVFNLVDGDVINIIAPEVKDDEALRAFHAAQVEKSLTVLPANIASMVELGKAIISEFT